MDDDRRDVETGRATSTMRTSFLTLLGKSSLCAALTGLALTGLALTGLASLGACGSNSRDQLQLVLMDADGASPFAQKAFSRLRVELHQGEGPLLSLDRPIDADFSVPMAIRNGQESLRIFVQLASDPAAQEASPEDDSAPLIGMTPRFFPRESQGLVRLPVLPPRRCASVPALALPVPVESPALFGTDSFLWATGGQSSDGPSGQHRFLDLLRVGGGDGVAQVPLGQARVHVLEGRIALVLGDTGEARVLDGAMASSAGVPVAVSTAAASGGSMLRLPDQSVLLVGGSIGTDASREILRLAGRSGIRRPLGNDGVAANGPAEEPGGEAVLGDDALREAGTIMQRGTMVYPRNRPALALLDETRLFFEVLVASGQAPSETATNAAFAWLRVPKDPATPIESIILEASLADDEPADDVPAEDEPADDVPVGADPGIPPSPDAPRFDGAALVETTAGREDARLLVDATRDRVWLLGGTASAAQAMHDEAEHGDDENESPDAGPPSSTRRLGVLRIEGCPDACVVGLAKEQPRWPEDATAVPAGEHALLSVGGADENGRELADIWRWIADGGRLSRIREGQLAHPRRRAGAWLADEGGRPGREAITLDGAGPDDSSGDGPSSSEAASSFSTGIGGTLLWVGGGLRAGEPRDDVEWCVLGDPLP